MTAIALGARRLTPAHGEGIVQKKFDIAVTATKVVKAGGLVCMISAGTVEPAKTATGLVAIGRADAEYDNSGSLSPAPVARILTGIFSWFQSGTTITAADIGSVCYMVDDQTVTIDSAGASPAGTIMGLDDDGTSVLVATSPLLPLDFPDDALPIQAAVLEIVGPTNTAAGQGTGADTNGTARTYNLGSALPAGAILQGYMVHLKTSFTGNTTLTATIGSTGQVSEIASAINLMGSTGYGQGTAGTKHGGLMPTADQLLLTLTPDGSSKVSAATVGDVKVTVFYTDATG